ncbi:MAG: glycosyltransferase family 61 protein [Proteobacteria bacterium]|nr:glycosyltransferase family 61 protein [Pseudomonadota bacterium]
MSRHYRRKLPALVRSLLYPDAFHLSDLPGRGMRAEPFRHAAGVVLSTPEAPGLGVWDQAPFAVTEHYTTPDLCSVILTGARYNLRLNLVTSRSGAALIDSTSTVLPIDGAAVTGRLRAGHDKVSGHCTVFRSVHNNYFHTLIDNLARVYLLRQEPYRSIGNIRMLFPSAPTRTEQFFLDRYLPGNIAIEVVSSNRMLAPESLIFPCFVTRRTAACLPPSYLQDMLPHFLPDRPRDRRHRIFISRRAGNRGELRVIRNEAQLYDQLHIRGFERYFLEDLSISEQIGLFYDAEAVVSAHGAGLSNLVFARDITVVELHPAQMMIPTYYYLCKSMGHNYAAWKGKHSHFEDNFSVDVDQVIELLPVEFSK